jgi:murein DD-endopeptidase MepM/ murein hydrolase activator NlpD
VLALSDDFLERKVPAIERACGLRPSGTLLDRYLHINRELRRQNEARIRELTTTSTPQPLWNGVFHMQPNTVSTSSFADRRRYTYRGTEVDHQTHLGCDLAAPGANQIAAVQDGIVVYTGDLGVYGNTVIVDHGLGIFSLYGHLGGFAVRPGERVTQGQSLGPMGDTGLAMGAHLHFSIIVNGVHVDPMEWWHPIWFDTHIAARLALLPRTAQQAPP